MRTVARLLPVIAFGFLVNCAPSPSATVEANKEVVRQLTSAINDRDFDLLDELVAPDVVRHSQATAGVDVRNLQQFKQLGVVVSHKQTQFAWRAGRERRGRRGRLVLGIRGG